MCNGKWNEVKIDHEGVDEDYNVTVYIYKDNWTMIKADYKMTGMTEFLVTKKKDKFCKLNM